VKSAEAHVTEHTHGRRTRPEGGRDGGRDRPVTYHERRETHPLEVPADTTGRTR